MTFTDGLTQTGPRIRRSKRKIAALGTAVAVALAGVGVVLAVTKPTDVQAVQVHEPNIWVNSELTGTPRYGRLNVDIMELTSVQETVVTFPRWIVQSPSRAVLIGGERYLTVDPAQPLDITEDTDLAKLRASVEEVKAAGDYVALRDDAGGVYVTTVDRLATGDIGSAVNETVADGSTERLVAADVSADGLLRAMSEDGTLISRDSSDPQAVPERVSTGIEVPQSVDSQIQLTSFGSSWALAVTAGGEPTALWINGESVEATLPADALLARASSSDRLAVATADGMTLFSADGQENTTARPDQAQRRPSAPTVLDDGCVLGVWTGSGSLTATTCSGDFVTLGEDPGATITDRIEIRRVGATVVLNNVSRGRLWVLEDGQWEFVPSSNDWVPPTESSQDEPEDNKIDATVPEPPKPPSTQDSVFGVRPGSVTRVPVLIGATDPNPNDILSIVPGSLAWSGNAPFPDAELVDGNTAIVVDATDVTEGGGKLSFLMTDGLGRDHEVPVTVRVNVHDYSIKTPPREVRAGNNGPQRLSAAPGAVVTSDVLKNWVDPDGDALAVSVSQPVAGTAIALPAGRIVFKAPDEASAASVDVVFAVTGGPEESVVAGNFGVQVREDAPIHVTPAAITGVVARDTTVPVSQFVNGAVDAIRITQLPEDSPSLTVRSTGAGLVLNATVAGEYTVAYGVTVGSKNASGAIRFTAIDAADAVPAASPVTIYVTPGHDTRVDLLDSVQNPGADALSLSDIELVTDRAPTVTASGVSVSAFEGASVRVEAQQGATVPGTRTLPDTGQFAGAFRYTVTAYAQSGDPRVISGLGSVYLIPEPADVPIIALPDSVEVAAGDVIDVAVLDNDVVPAGADLVLDPRPLTYGPPVDLPSQGLAFASGSVMRILAPMTPGTIEIPYQVFPRGNPNRGVRGVVHVTVIDPSAATTVRLEPLTGQVYSRSQTTIPLPRTGVGTANLVVEKLSEPTGLARVEIGDDGRSIRVESKASVGTAAEPIRFTATVGNGESTIAVPVTVSVIDARPEPVAFNDYRYEPLGSTIDVSPLVNDVVPRGQVSRITKVEELTEAKVDGALALVPVPVDTIGDDATSFSAQVRDVETTYRYTIATGLPDAENNFDPARELGEQLGEAVASVSVVPSEESIPQYPRISDSYVGSSAIVGQDSATGNDQFEIDVVAGKLIWSGEALALSLVDSASPDSTDGVANVSGTLAQNARITPFELKVAGSGGADDEPVIQSYGFVHVPSAKLIKPELRDPSRVYTVNEGESVSVDLADAVVTPPGRRLAIAPPSVGAQRQDGDPPATCVLRGTTLTYSPGMGSPRTEDDCYVDLSWEGDSESTVRRAIPMKIVLENSPPEFQCTKSITAVQRSETAITESLSPCITWDTKSGRGNKSDLNLVLLEPTNLQDVKIAVSGQAITVSDVANTAEPRAIPVTVALEGPEGRFDPDVTAVVNVTIVRAPAVPLKLPVIREVLELPGFDSDSPPPVTATVDVLSQVKARLDEDYFGWDNGRIDYGQDPCATPTQLTCQAQANGSTLQVAIDVGDATSPTGSFEKTIQYHVEDRAPGTGGTVNSGSGEIVLTFKSVPARPTLVLDKDIKEDGRLKFTVSGTSGDVARCRMFEDGTEIGEQAATGGSCAFTHKPGQAFQSHEYAAQVRFADSGWSARSEPVKAMAYEEVAKPKVSWWPVPGSTANQVRVKVEGINTAGLTSFDVNVGGDFEEVKVSARSAYEVTFNDVPSSGAALTVTPYLKRNGAEEAGNTWNYDQVYGVGEFRSTDLKAIVENRTSVEGAAEVDTRNAKYRYGWGINGERCVPTRMAGDSAPKLDGSVINSQPVNTIFKVTFCARVENAKNIAGKYLAKSAMNVTDKYGPVVTTSPVDAYVIGKPDAADVQSKVRYQVTGNFATGFAVTPTAASIKIKDVTFDVEPATGNPTKSNRKAKVKLKARGVKNGQAVPVSISGSFEINPADGAAEYVPSGDHVPSLSPAVPTCSLPAGDGTGGGATVTVTRPNFSGADGADWEWVVTISSNVDGEIDSLPFDSAAGPYSWSSPSGSDYIAATYRVSANLQFKGALSGIGSDGTSAYREFGCDEVPGGG